MKFGAPDFDVTIVGGGFAGSMVAVHLARAAPHSRILLVDKAAAFGRGVAYENGPPRLLLNVPAGKMSALPDDAGHFVRWLQARSVELRHEGVTETGPEAFIPRGVYGQYIRDIFHGTASIATGLETDDVEIVDIEDRGEILVLTDHHGKTFTSAKAVLALGNFPPGDPPLHDRGFHQSARYLSAPWSAGTLRQIGRSDDVLILGAGLTALDLLQTLEATEHSGTIHVVSRRGLFPQAQHPYRADLDLYKNRELPNTVRAWVRLVRETARTAECAGSDWRAAVDALRPMTQSIWKSLDLEERRRFLRHVRPFWESHRHRAAPSVLAVTDRLKNRAQLICHQARVTSIREAGGGLDVVLFSRAKRSEIQLHVSMVANCTGPECNYYKLRERLVLNLLARGLIHPDPLFLGLVTAPNGAVINYLGQSSESIYTLGSVQRGMLFETTAVPEIRIQAQNLAKEILKVQTPGSRNFGRSRAGSTPSEKIILISNRGPNDFVWRDGQWIPKIASGGLVSMIDPLARQPDVAWFCCVSEPPSANDTRAALYTTAADQTDVEHHIVPVPLPAKIYQAYYGAISNEVLWMLQHHLVGQFGYSALDAARHRAWAEGYLEANRRMVVAIRASGIIPRAFLIQDYHFYPLPALLREVFPNTPSLHFTHIPFPDSATLKLIPQAWRNTILNGLLGADVIGMQTWWDARPFLGCCEELLGATVDYQASTVATSDSRLARVVVLPASANPDAVRRTMQSDAVQRARERLAAYPARPTVIRVDRLDPSKNQIIGFQAFERLLELRPDLRGTVRFLAFLVPSRTDLNVYREYRDAVYASIDQVNQRFCADCGGPPIEVFYTNDREQALAAMEFCDVLLVNSREDGMNLVVKEWAIVSNRPGVAVISETAGVAGETGPDALLVSPLDIEGTAQALAQAFDMPAAEREARLGRMRARVEAWTAEHWLTAQLKALSLAEPASR